MPREIYVRTEEYRRNRNGIGNPMWNRHHSDETRRKISNSKKGKKLPSFSEEHRRHLSESGKGRYISDETRKKMSESHRGKLLSEETRKKLSKIRKGRLFSEEHRRHLSESGKGRYCSEKTRKKISVSTKGKYISRKTRIKISKATRMEKNPNWLGGKSFEPYGLEFNRILRKHIRKRDNYECQECNRCQNELKIKLHVHHIDFNKKNNRPENLISLCVSCHTKTNFSRSDWTKHFMKLMLSI